MSILALSAIILAFLVFMAAVAWADRQTRNLSSGLQPVQAKASIQAARPARG